MNLQKHKKALELFAHLAGWAVFFKLMLPGDGLMPHSSYHFIANILLLVGYFYLNMNVLVPRLLSKKKVAAYLGVTLLCFFLICFAMPSLVQPLHGFDRPPEMPFPRRPLDLFPPQGAPLRQGMISRWQLYGMRMHNPTIQFLFVFIISAGLKVLTQWYREQQQLMEMEKSKIEAELSFLKTQMHPHFLFNCLNSIYYMTLSKDDKAPKTVLSLADFLRFVITESDSSLIPVEKEINMLKEYLNLQRLRISEKFELSFEGEGDFGEYSIMPLTFIPFVENAFKYGISAHSNCFIHINIRMENGMLAFACDNSVMPAVKDRARSSGVGLENIKKRLALAYPQRHSLEISEDSLAFHVKLQIRIV
ncbi:MAG: sensor histidine kinase [Tannerellaceae bacterium]|nr:sensor histidine kinase [Tannerellaceae bacterium]